MRTSTTLEVFGFGGLSVLGFGLLSLNLLSPILYNITILAHFLSLTPIREDSIYLIIRRFKDS